MVPAHPDEPARGLGARGWLAVNVRCFAGPVAARDAGIVVQKGLSAASDTALPVLIGPELTYITVGVIPVSKKVGGQRPCMNYLGGRRRNSDL